MQAGLYRQRGTSDLLGGKPHAGLLYLQSRCLHRAVRQEPGTSLIIDASCPFRRVAAALESVALAVFRSTPPISAGPSVRRDGLVSRKWSSGGQAGYHPSASSLSCFAGTLTPATWQCEEDRVEGRDSHDLQDPCPAPKNIKNAPQLTCRQGDSIVSGTSCTTLCNPGYSPRYKSLAPWLGCPSFLTSCRFFGRRLRLVSSASSPLPTMSVCRTLAQCLQWPID